LPHAARLLTDQLDELLEWAECLVIGSPLDDVAQVLASAREEQVIIDLVRAAPQITTRAEYHGLGWEIPTRGE